MYSALSSRLAHPLRPVHHVNLPTAMRRNDGLVIMRMEMTTKVYRADRDRVPRGSRFPVPVPSRPPGVPASRLEFFDGPAGGGGVGAVV